MNPKTIKKISILLVLALMFSIIVPVISNASYEEVKEKLAISSAKGEIGQEVTVTITTKSETTITNMDSLIKYDRTKLQVVEAKESTISGTMMVVNDRYNHAAGPDGVVIGVVSTGDPVKMATGTVLATIKFKILEGADTTNTLNYVYDMDGEPSLATGTITVTKPSTSTDTSTDTSITLNKTSLSLNVAENNTAEIEATVVPDTNADIVWSSSNTEVATVSGRGKKATVTAVKKGTANITATVNGKTATCSVTVSASKLTSIFLSEPPTEVVKSKEFKFKVTPNEGAEIEGENIVWETSDKNIATVDGDGTVHPLKEGVVTITAKIGEISDSKTFTVKDVSASSDSEKDDNTKVPDKDGNEEDLNKPSKQPEAGTISPEENDDESEKAENKQTETDKSEEKEAKEKENKSSVSILPNTGDMAIYTFVALMIISAVVIVLVIRRNRN